MLWAEEESYKNCVGGRLLGSWCKIRLLASPVCPARCNCAGLREQTASFLTAETWGWIFTGQNARRMSRWNTHRKRQLEHCLGHLKFLQLLRHWARPFLELRLRKELAARHDKKRPHCLSDALVTTSRRHARTACSSVRRFQSSCSLSENWRHSCRPATFRSFVGIPVFFFPVDRYFEYR